MSQHDIMRRKLVIVGDGACGKTCLLSTSPLCPPPRLPQSDQREPLPLLDDEPTADDPLSSLFPFFPTVVFSKGTFPEVRSLPFVHVEEERGERGGEDGATGGLGDALGLAQRFFRDPGQALGRWRSRYVLGRLIGLAWGRPGEGGGNLVGRGTARQGGPESLLSPYSQSLRELELTSLLSSYPGLRPHRLRGALLPRSIPDSRLTHERRTTSPTSSSTASASSSPSGIPPDKRTTTVSAPSRTPTRTSSSSVSPSTRPTRSTTSRKSGSPRCTTFAPTCPSSSWHARRILGTMPRRWMS